MTSSVPYSFVPGTKAKAEEVNANFIALLDKIENSNIKIDDLTLSKMKTDLSNINDSGKKYLSDEMDGKWTSTEVTLFERLTPSEKYTQTFDLSEALPNDGKIYEILLTGMIRTNLATNSIFGMCATTSLCTSTHLCRAVTRVNGVCGVASCGVILPIGTDREITIFSGGESTAPAAPNSCSFKISAYRRVK